MTNSISPDLSNLLKSDPQFAEFAGFFTRLFYGCEWLGDGWHWTLELGLGFPIKLEPRHAGIPPSKLADIFRYYFERDTKPDPEVLMQNLLIGSWLGRISDGCGLRDTQEKVRHALKQHLYQSFCTAMEQARIQEYNKSGLVTHEESPGLQEHETSEEEYYPQSTRGREATAEVDLRCKIVGDHIQNEKDWHDIEKRKALVKELKKADIPTPRDKGGVEHFLPSLDGVMVSWDEILLSQNQNRLDRAIKIMGRWRWPEKKPSASSTTGK